MNGAYNMKNTIIKFISSYIEDILIFIGLLMLVITTYKINNIAGSYLLSVIFILIGILISKKPPKN